MTSHPGCMESKDRLLKCHEDLVEAVEIAELPVDLEYNIKSAAEKPKQADGPLFLMVSTEYAAAYPHRT